MNVLLLLTLIACTLWLWRTDTVFRCRSRWIAMAREHVHGRVVAGEFGSAEELGRECDRLLNAMHPWLLCEAMLGWNTMDDMVRDKEALRAVLSGAGAPKA
jgi:hypothetical protein